MIGLIPQGAVDEGLLAVIRDGLSDALGSPPVLINVSFGIEAMLDRTRGQYDSTRILLQLRAMSDLPSASPDKILCITPHDLYIPVLTYVFGEAELGGNVAVVSYYRFQNERYGLPPNYGLLAERLLKESLHETGHMFGLTHCRSQECVMHASASVEEVDLKGTHYCEICGVSMERAVFPMKRTPRKAVSHRFFPNSGTFFP
jgi:archaemetzincin